MKSEEKSRHIRLWQGTRLTAISLPVCSWVVKVCLYQASSVGWMCHARYSAFESVLTSGVNLWLQKNRSLKWRMRCALRTSTPLSFINSQFYHSCAPLDDLEKALFHLLWSVKTPITCHEVQCLHPSNGSLGMPDKDTARYFMTSFSGSNVYTWEWASFFQKVPNSFCVWVHSAKGEPQLLPQGECSYYKCYHVQKVLSQKQAGFRDLVIVERGIIVGVRSDKGRVSCHIALNAQVEMLH